MTLWERILATIAPAVLAALAEWVRQVLNRDPATMSAREKVKHIRSKRFRDWFRGRGGDPGVMP